MKTKSPWQRIGVRAALLFTLAVTALRAAPVVENNTGYFFDDYLDLSGMVFHDQVRIAPAGTVSLVPPNTSGNYVTVTIVPSSFDQWGQLTLVGTYGAVGDLMVEVLDQNGAALVPPIGPQPLNGPISLASLNSALVPGIQVKVYFNQTAAATPTVNSLRVTWHPVSQLLLDKQGPFQVQAGENIVYHVRYSVNYVQANSLVVWDTLPSYPGSVTYPANYGQNDNPIFVSAAKGGIYTAVAALVNGVNVPPNSVYWNLGDVPEGITDLLEFTVATKNGTLDGTTVANVANANAANAVPTQTQLVVTTIHSAPAPSLIKQEAGGIFNIGGVLQTSVGSVNSYSLVARNSGTETMYNAVVYDDVSSLMNMIQNSGPLGFFNISGGGTFIANFNPGTGPIPAIVWNVGALAPGAAFSGSFSVQLLLNPPQMQYVNQACLTSDQTTPTCDQITVKLPLDDSTSGAPAATFQKTASASIVPYGGTVVFTLSTQNKYAVKLNDLLLLDLVPANTIFLTAWFNDPNLIASGAKIFYSTSLLFPNQDSPPPVDYTQAAFDILDVVGNTYWESYDLNPPVNPAAVTWVAYFIPQVDSYFLPNQGTPALPPSTPITAAAGSFDVNVLTPADPCTDTTLSNHGLFRAYELTDLSGNQMVNPNGTLSFTADVQVSAQPYKGSLSASAFISPNPVAVPGVATYSLTVANSAGPTSDALANVQAVLQLTPVVVNGLPQFPSVQGISPAGTYNALAGQITIPLGLMGVGASRTIQVQLGFPAGILNETTYSVSATIIGQDDQCGNSTVSVSTSGQVQASPKLIVTKRVDADLIPSAAAFDYFLDYENLGTAPSTGTWIVERVPNKAVFVQAMGNPNITAVWFSSDDNLPPQALTPLAPINGNIINTYFTQGAPPVGGVWASPFGDQTRWVAWEVDDPAFSIPQFLLNTLKTVSFTVRNDDNGPLAGTAGSPQGTQLYNSAAIFSSELLQAIGNQVITTINDQPSIIVAKTGPSAVEAGVDFNWVVTYHNDTLSTPDDTVVITDTLPPGVSLVGATATLTWNPAAVDNGAPMGDQNVTPSSTMLNSDGSATLTFNIAGPAGYRGVGTPLAGLEGGALTLTVRADSTTPSGTTRLNEVCGTATTAGDTATSCASHQVTIFRPDLELQKYVSPEQVLSGGTLTYQMVVANHGPIAARGVSLTDILPDGVTYVPGSLSVSPDYTLLAPSISGQTLTWNLANGNALTQTGFPAAQVPATSGNILIQFNVTVGGSIPGCTTLNNVAQVSTVSFEEGVYPNNASASATVPPPELAVAQSGPTLARPGNRVSWNITWVNQSPQAASGVYLVDTLPNDGASPDSDVKFASVAVPPGVTPYFHAGPISPAPAFDPLNPLANGWSVNQTIPVDHIALLVGALAGNAGPFTAQVSADLVDPLSHILPSAGASFTNRVVISQAVPLCENTANNTAIAVVRTPDLDLALTKTSSVQGAIPGLAPGQPITYTLAVVNSGTVNAYGVKVLDTLPATLVPGNTLDNFTVVNLVDGNGSPVSPVDPSGNPIVGAVPVTRVFSGGNITWYLGTTTPSDALYYQKVGLPPGSQGIFQLYTTVAASVADNTDICNSATVAADVGTEDVLENNTSQSCTTVHRADLAIRKSGVEIASGDPSFVEAGNLLQYTIEYNNLGSFNAQNVSLNEIIPPGSTLVSVNPPPGATVTYSPSQASATSFSVQFDTLPAPANSVGFPQNLNGPAPSAGARPVLHIQLLGNPKLSGYTNVLITWDAAFTGFILEQNNRLELPDEWTPVLSPLRVFPGNQQGVLLPFDPSSPFAIFFRLTSGPRCSPGEYVYVANANPDGFLGWNTLYVNDNIPAGANILYSVGRWDGSAIVYDLGPNYTSVTVGPNGLSLSGINPAYTELVLRAALSSANGSNGVSSCLNAWQMTYNSSIWPSFTFTVRVDTNGCGPLPIDNVVSISTTTPEITLANNTASYSMNTRLTDLQVQCGVNKAAALPGESLAYTIDWSVAGPQSASNAYLQIVLPDGNGDGTADVTLDTVTPGTGVTAYYNTVSTLAPPAFDPSDPLANGWTTSPTGANHVAFLLGNPDPSTGGTITYTDSINTGTDGETLISCVNGHTTRRETDCDNNSGCCTTYVGTLANVHVEISGPGSCVNPGELVPFTIRYGNNGNAVAVNVVLADALLPGLTFVSASPAPTGPGLTWNNLGSTPGTLGAGETGVINLVAQLDNNYALVGQHPVNVATISTTSGEVNLADDIASVPLPCITADFVSISGYVYQDANNDGVRKLSLGELGILGVTITLTGPDVFGTPVALATTTDQNGQYSFIGLNPGAYTVTETQPDGFTMTADSLGTVNGATRGVNLLPQDGVLGPIMLNGGDVGLEYDFGEQSATTVALLTCATNKTVECGTAWTFDPPTATNACCTNVTLTVLSTVTNNLGPCQMLITRTWQAIDCCTNVGTCDQTVTVVDTTPPTISCSSPPVITNCTATVPSVSVVASDNCTPANALVITQHPPAGTSVGPGTYPITVTVLDACGNSNSCQSTFTVTAPPPDWAWITPAGGPANDDGYAIARDANGNVYVTGLFAQTAVFGSFTMNSAGGGDVFIAKLDPAGNYLWVVQAGGSGSDVGYGIGVDGLGNVYVAGTHSASATFGSFTLTGGGGFVTKLDANGNFLWAKELGPDVSLSCLAVDATGNSYVAGNSGALILAAKLDPNGNLVWADSAPGSYSGSLRGIALDGSGNVYVTGWFEDGAITFGPTTLSPTAPGIFDLFVAKMDGSGNFLWATQGAGGADKFGLAVTVDAAGANVYVTGAFSGAATFGSSILNSAGGSDIFIARLDANGNYLWAQSAGGLGVDSGNGIGLDRAGNVYVAGGSGSGVFGSRPFTAARDADAFVAKMDSSGNFLWVERYGGMFSDAATGIAVDAPGCAYVTGYFGSPASSGPQPLVISGNDDIFTAIICSPCLPPF